MSIKKGGGMLPLDRDLAQEESNSAKKAVIFRGKKISPDWKDFSSQSKPEAHDTRVPH